MKKLTSTLSAGACLLFLSAAGSHGQDLLFSSDMSPPGHDGAEYTVDGVPDQWWPGSTGAGVSWLFDETGVKTGNSNSYFLEGTQTADGDGAVGIGSRFFSDYVGDFTPYQGQDFAINFDVKISDGATGRLDFRLDQHGIGINNVVLNSNNGFNDFGAEWNGSSSSVDAGNGWRSVTLTGTLDASLTNMHIFTAPWSFGGGSTENDAHFVGTYAIDNVEFTAIPEPGTYALLGGLLALGVCLVRRRAIPAKRA